MELTSGVTLITFEQELHHQPTVTGWLHLIRLQQITTQHKDQTAHLLHVVCLEYPVLLIVMDIEDYLN